jgi:hypothetical protein
VPRLRGRAPRLARRQGSPLAQAAPEAAGAGKDAAPMTLAAYAVLHLLKLTGLDGQMIEVNPDQIVSLRVPREDQERHIHEKAQCLIHTTDGKFISVIETCERVQRLLEESK